MVRVGIVGAGSMGSLHAKLLRERSDVELIGFADVDAERALARAKEFGGRAYTSPVQLVEAGAEAVFVAVPNTKHTDILIQCLEAGVRVFCEKPMVTSLKDAERVMAVVGDREDQLYIGFNRRFACVYAHAKETVRNGFRVFSGNFIMNDGDMTNPPWVTNIELTGGFLYDTTIHMFDMVRYLVGEVVEVRTTARSCVYPLADDFSIELTTSEGQSILLSSNGHASWLWPSERVQLWGDHETIVTEELDTVTYFRSGERAAETVSFRHLDRERKWGYYQMHNDFFASFLTNAPPSIRATDGYHAVRIADACYRSASLGGKAIRL
ncbi:MAG: Gfo/Idh/MocA family oxidoreductase [Alicyclobacillus sp.]|nr:Gfo/Idh/MocA family oxidoreductase [Alicyclobacillus sp.]